MEPIIGYKFLTDELKSKNGNEQWELDIWKEWNGKLELCASGFHACRTPLQSLKYIYGNRWFLVEASGEVIEEKNDKFVCSRMRIIHELPTKEIMLRFAIACAKNSLFRFEQIYPNDKRPRTAIEIAEAVLLGKLKPEEAGSAALSAESAGSAALSAESAESAAWSAARSAESAALSAESAESAAWSAARSAESAAWSAALSAALSAGSAALSAGSAAWSAEEKWQNKTLERIIREYI